MCPLRARQSQMRGTATESMRGHRRGAGTKQTALPRRNPEGDKDLERRLAQNRRPRCFSFGLRQPKRKVLVSGAFGVCHGLLDPKLAQDVDEMRQDLDDQTLAKSGVALGRFGELFASGLSARDWCRSPRHALDLGLSSPTNPPSICANLHLPTTEDS